MTAIELKQYIYENEKIEYILEDLGCEKIVCHSDKYTSCYPITGDNPMGVVIKLCPQLNYYSYSRGVHIEEGKDILSLIQEVKGFNFLTTIKYTHNLFGLKYEFSKPKKEKEAPMFDLCAVFKRADAKTKKRKKCDISEIQYLDEDILSDFYPGIHIDLFREGIIKKTIDKFKLGYSYKWKRTIIPHYYWLDGRLIGYNARTSIKNYDLFDIKKYFITPNMKKENNLYGLYQNMEEIERKHVIVIGESEKSVLKRDSRGDGTWVALSGKTISEEQIRIIIGLNVKDVVIALDKDVPIEEIWSICDRLYISKNVFYIYDKYDLLGEKDSPADAPNKIYEYLYKHKIKYTEETHKKYIESKTRRD